MSADVRLVKLAVIRDPAVPPGQPAPCWLECRCGLRVEVELHGGDVECGCGQRYSSNGWMLERRASSSTPSAWERAHRLGRRAFFEQSTATIRACPENYCLAFGGPGRWRVYREEGATRPQWDAIERVIETWAAGSTSDALADEIGRVLTPRSGAQ